MNAQSTNQIKRWELGLLFLLFTLLAPAMGAETEPVGSKEKRILQKNENGETSLEQPTKGQEATSLSQIVELQTTLQELIANRSNSEGVRQEVADARVLRTLNQLVSISHSTAQTFQNQRSKSGDPDAQRLQIVTTINSLPSIIGSEIGRIRQQVNLPLPEQTALEQASVSAEIRVQANEIDNLIDALISNIEIARQLGMDTSSVEAALRQHIVRRAEDTSAYLDVTTEHLSKLRDQLAALPKNDELAAKIAVTQRHLLLTVDVLRDLAAKMEALGIDPTAVNTQLISATGALTTDILKLGVVSRLIGDSARNMFDWISNNGARIVFQTLIFIAILLIAWKAAQLVEMVTRRALQSSRVHLSRLLQRMIISGSRSAILVLGVLIGLSQLGFSLGPLLAGLGIAGFIIGFALQDSLSNFASGLMILVYRPFDVGDLVDVNGAFGTVRQMSLVNTTILTIDNRTLIVPNNKIWGDVIKNITLQDRRRIDMEFRVAYDQNIQKVKTLLQDIITSHEKILADPSPTIEMDQLSPYAMIFVVRPWVERADYWSTKWELLQVIKEKLDSEGIKIPVLSQGVIEAG
jgi:small conductance mechanosensitive channel